MAIKTKVTPQKEEMLEREGPETPPDRPLLDLSNASVKALIRTAKKRGYVTYDQINSLAEYLAEHIPSQHGTSPVSPTAKLPAPQ